VRKQSGSRKPLISLSLALLLLGAGTGATRADSIPASPAELNLLVQSELAEASNDPGTAVALAESLAAGRPWSAFAAARVAAIYEDTGEDGRALAWGERALSLDSLNVPAAMLVGRMYLRAGSSALAAQVLTPPLRQLGAPPELYALRALAHELDRNYEASLADLRRTDVLIFDFAWVATGVLGLALEEGRLDEAYQALQLALELNPGDSRALGLGVTLAKRRGDVVLEETLLRQLATAADARLDQIADYAACLARQGKERDVKTLQRWAEARGVEPARLSLATGLALADQREYRAALKVLKPLGNDDRALPLRARAWVALGEERKALRGYRELLSTRALSPEESLVTAYLEIRVGSRRTGVLTLERIRPGLADSPRQVLAGSLCYSLLGHPEEAVALMREGTIRGLESPSIYEELGAAASAVGDSLLAEWAFQRLRGMGRETSECLYFLGAAELAQGDVGRALRSLARSAELDPRNGKALLLLGTIRYQLGMLESAREALIRSASCPESARGAYHALAEVCRALRLDSEARAAESKARSHQSPPPAGLSLFGAP
jgi:tetratricopeptide (TPR) repeat protein